VLGQIGSGGFSTVDLVQSSQTGKKFAVKRITCHSIEDQNCALQEVKITGSMQHPHIVRVLGCETRGQADILHGGQSEVRVLLPLYKQSLHDELERRQAAGAPLATPVLLSIFSGVCQAVRELHTAEPPLAHRDIKPQNILLDRDLSPVLMDFGSCAPARVTVNTLKEAQYLQDTAAERCSMTYRPPELHHVATGAALDQRTDVWSLGCLLYALMFYKGPFDAVLERGDSVALAVQGGAMDFPEKEEDVRRLQLQQLVVAMTNMEIGFRIDIHTVIDRIGRIEEMDPDVL